jgi:hypothetical protein
MEVMNMNRKAKRLKKDTGTYRNVGIAGIVFAVMLWIAVAFLWGMLEGYLGNVPWVVLYVPLIVWILFGIYLLANGIGLLHFTGKVAEILKDIVPDEDDE